MRIVTSDRSGEVPGQVREAVEQRLSELGRHFDLLRAAEVEFDQQAKRGEQPVQVVEIKLWSAARHLEPIRARETGRRLDEVVNLVLDKVDREILKLKEQVRAYP